MTLGTHSHARTTLPERAERVAKRSASRIFDRAAGLDLRYLPRTVAEHVIAQEVLAELQLAVRAARERPELEE